MSVYFNKKDELKEKAVSHYKMMEAGFKDEIEECVKNTKTYGGDGIAVAAAAKREDEFDLAGDTETTETAKPIIIVDKLDSVKSAIQHRDGKTAVLNFASYKNPGGKFMEGSSAQEECLCHASTLYNVLKQFPVYYQWNRVHNNRALYTNRALYSEDVIFWMTVYAFTVQSRSRSRLMLSHARHQIFLQLENTQGLRLMKTMPSCLDESSLFWMWQKKIRYRL